MAPIKYPKFNKLESPIINPKAVQEYNTMCDSELFIERFHFRGDVIVRVFRSTALLKSMTCIHQTIIRSSNLVMGDLVVQGPTTAKFPTEPAKREIQTASGESMGEVK